MPRSLLVATAVVSTGVLLAACSDSAETPDTSSEEPAAAEQEAPQDALPNDEMPADAVAEVPRDAWEECPYLDTQWVADTNGQRMTNLGVDHRFMTPACVFWSYPEEPQATVMVRHMPNQQEAINVVDWAAPIDATDPVAWEGWNGGRGVLDGVSVYSIFKDNIAVTVWSNQEQTVKAESIAQQTVANLEL